MMEPFQVLFAFFLGILSVASPCVLPILPGYLSFVFGADRLGMIKGSVIVYLGVMAGGCALAAIVSAVGGFIGGRWLYGISAAILALIILDMLFTHRVRGAPVGRVIAGKRGNLAGFLFGTLIIFIASPCITPLLAAVSVYALTLEEALSRFLLLTAYAAGLGLPFVIIGAFSNFGKRLMRISRWSRAIQLAILFATLAWLLWSFSIA